MQVLRLVTTFPPFPQINVALAVHFRVQKQAKTATLLLRSLVHLLIIFTPEMNRYQRNDVLRILRITGQQLAQWQKAGLIAAGEVFSFFDLLQVKKIRDLRAKHVRPAVIRASLEAMQKQVAGM